MEIVAETPERVVAVYAHPADAEIACGGALARWVRAGAQVHLTVCARGDKGSWDPATDSATLAQTRATEVAESADVLGLADHEVLGIPDGEVDDSPELRRRLVARVRVARPDVVVGPDPTAVVFGNHYVNHRDHRQVGWALLDAVAPAAANPLYFPDAGPAHQVRDLYLSGSLDPDVAVDIGEVLEAKAGALACHRTQLGDVNGLVDELVRRRAEEAGAVAGLRYAESFRRIRIG